MIVRMRNVVRIALGTALILVILLIVDSYSDEMFWGLLDFVVAGILLFGAGLAYELLSRKVSTSARRIAVAVAIGILLLLIWAEIAVGIFEALFSGS